MNKFLKYIRIFNFKSLYFNLKYLPYKQAIKLPIIVSNNVCLKKMKGILIIDSIIKTGMISIGYGEVSIFDKKRSRSIWHVSGKVIFKGEAYIGHGSKISVNQNGLLELGVNFTISAESSIIVNKHIKFGNNCLIAWDCLIMDTDFHKIRNMKGEIVNPSEPIVIGNNVWIGCRSIILKGTKTSDNSIIGANSMLNKDISANEGLFIGNPAILIKKGYTWDY